MNPRPEEGGMMRESYPWLKEYRKMPGCPEPFVREMNELFAIADAAERWRNARVAAIKELDGTWSPQLRRAEQDFWASLPPLPENS